MCAAPHDAPRVSHINSAAVESRRPRFGMRVGALRYIYICKVGALACGIRWAVGWRFQVLSSTDVHRIRYDNYAYEYGCAYRQVLMPFLIFCADARLLLLLRLRLPGIVSELCLRQCDPDACALSSSIIWMLIAIQRELENLQNFVECINY